jgi:hypothetical protein
MNSLINSGRPKRKSAVHQCCNALFVPSTHATLRPGGLPRAANALLRVGRKWVRLYGVYIPSIGRQCRTLLQPAYRGKRAAVALGTRIQGFVFCRPVSRNRDGSLNAFCSVERTFYSNGVDLGAHLPACAGMTA